MDWGIRVFSAFCSHAARFILFDGFDLLIMGIAYLLLWMASSIKTSSG